MERAEEVQANLSPQFPSFLKLMLKSHVTGGFWLVSRRYARAIEMKKKDIWRINKISMNSF